MTNILFTENFTVLPFICKVCQAFRFVHGMLPTNYKCIHFNACHTIQFKTPQKKQEDGLLFLAKFQVGCNDYSCPFQKILFVIKQKKTTSSSYKFRVTDFTLNF